MKIIEISIRSTNQVAIVGEEVIVHEIDYRVHHVACDVPSNLHPVASYVDPLAVLRREYGYYLGELHAEAQHYDAVAKRSTDEQSGLVHSSSKLFRALINC